MINLTRSIKNTLSVRISLMVVLATAVLLTAALLVMFTYSRKVMREEALTKAAQTLEAIVQNTDNVLLSVEQAAGNTYCDLMLHLDEPQRMADYSRHLVESNPYITDCVIVMEPDSTYKGELWYEKPMQTGHPCWIDPKIYDTSDGDALTTFCLPIYNREGRTVGVLAADVSVALLTSIVMEAKPTPNAYATLLGSDGSYIVHPDSTKRLNQTVFTQTEHGADPTVLQAAQAMVGGEKGYQHVVLDGRDHYVFYKPFVRSHVQGRSTDNLGWSVGIVFPEDDIFGDYNDLLWVVLVVATVGLLLLLLLLRLITHHQLLPLRLLTQQAQHIAEGHYDEPIPESQHSDEVGRLQDRFVEMQKALAARMGELRRLRDALKERGEVLREAYEQAREADRVKTAFLHHMSNQMAEPVGRIYSDADALCSRCRDMEQAEAAALVDSIQDNGKVVTKLLNDLLDVAQENNKH